mmetsp:Transcript_60400/g.187022  ORF Transcript_60400/g.187022 Transcript_60400/m.187022 type:complete len:290 (-) Transcript_60400:276-1145(-)
MGGPARLGQAPQAGRASLRPLAQQPHRALRGHRAAAGGRLWGDAGGAHRHLGAIAEVLPPDRIPDQRPDGQLQDGGRASGSHGPELGLHLPVDARPAGRDALPAARGPAATGSRGERLADDPGRQDEGRVGHEEPGGRVARRELHAHEGHAPAREDPREPHLPVEDVLLGAVHRRGLHEPQEAALVGHHAGSRPRRRGLHQPAGAGMVARAAQVPLPDEPHGLRRPDGEDLRGAPQRHHSNHHAQRLLGVLRARPDGLPPCTRQLVDGGHAREPRAVVEERLPPHGELP